MTKKRRQPTTYRETYTETCPAGHTVRFTFIQDLEGDGSQAGVTAKTNALKPCGSCQMMMAAGMKLIKNNPLVAEAKEIKIGNQPG